MRATLKSTTNLATFACDTLVIPAYEDLKLNTDSRAIDKASKKQLAKILASDDFSGHSGETVTLRGIAGTTANRIVLWGLGDKDKLNRQALLKACDSLAKTVTALPGKHCGVLGSLKTNKAVPISWALQQIAARIARTTYLYTTTKPSKKNPVTLARLSVVNADSSSANRQAISQGAAIGQGINIARELGNLPGNICTPKYLSAQARKLAKQHAAIKTTVLGEKQMQALSMDSLLSVGHGSVEESQLMVINYQGGKKSQKPHVLVGKGITFDSGGISLKPGARMDEMKFDMCGAASVMGAMKTVAEQNLPINIIAVIAAAENMPSDRATRPGDIVTSMSGQTIEVLNTDAEGRLVLCDALTYVDKFDPETVIDVATLTGACVVALGSHASALYANDDKLAQDITEAGEDSLDRVWRMPLWDEYQPQINSAFADMANIGGPQAGSITAACFLSRFTKKYRWAHLDIAGSAFKGGTTTKGSTGRPVGLLVQYLMDRVAESK